METRLRLLLVLSGLPRPHAQVRITDEAGRFLGRPDLCYPEQRLCLEYDGGAHRENLVADNPDMRGQLPAFGPRAGQRPGHSPADGPPGGSEVAGQARGRELEGLHVARFGGGAEVACLHGALLAALAVVVAKV